MGMLIQTTAAVFHSRGYIYSYSIYNLRQRRDPVLGKVLGKVGQNLFQRSLEFFIAVGTSWELREIVCCREPVYSYSYSYKIVRELYMHRDHPGVSQIKSIAHMHKPLPPKPSSIV